MLAVYILMVIFGGIALITYTDNVSKNRRRAALPSSAGTDAPALPAPTEGQPHPAAPESLILRLPEPARTRAWALLCLVADAQLAERSKHLGLEGDTRTSYLLAQTRQAYLPDTAQAYLGLTPGARRRLESQGQPPETLLDEQLRLLEDGVRQALRHDHATADRLLTQGRFLRERFGPGADDLALPPDSGRSGELARDRATGLPSRPAPPPDPKD